MGIKAVLSNNRRKATKAYAVYNGQRRIVSKAYAVVNGTRKLVWNVVQYIVAVFQSRSGFSSSYDTGAVGTKTYLEITTANPSTRCSITVKFEGLESGSHTLVGDIDGYLSSREPSDTTVKVGFGTSTSPSASNADTFVDYGEVTGGFTRTATGTTLYAKFEIPKGGGEHDGYQDFTYIDFKNVELDGIPIDFSNIDENSGYQP